MTESFVLHLHSRLLKQGDVCGVVEVVATSERHTITTIVELNEVLISRSAGDRAGGPPLPSEEWPQAR